MLLSINLLLDYLLLLATAKFLGLPYRKVRLLLGALSGAAASLIILLPSLPFLLSSGIKLLTCGGMALAAYPWASWRDFCKRTACLFLVSFLFAGMLLALSYFLKAPGLFVQNNAVYVAVSPLVLAVGAVGCYFVLSLLYRITGRRGQGHTFCQVTVFYEGKSVSFPGKIDTGNSLTEPFSGLPVLVTEQAALKDVLPLEIAQGVLTAEVKSGIRLIPFTSVGGQGVLPAFRPERCVIQRGKEEITVTDCYIAVTPKKLSTTYRSLLSPDLLVLGQHLKKDMEAKL